MGGGIRTVLIRANAEAMPTHYDISEAAADISAYDRRCLPYGAASFRTTWVTWWKNPCVDMLPRIMNNLDLAKTANRGRINVMSSVHLDVLW